jgi:hypothetical protein
MENWQGGSVRFSAEDGGRAMAATTAKGASSTLGCRTNEMLDSESIPAE